MNIEVELKVKVDDFDEVKFRLEKAGKFVRRVHQVDTYFNSPHRDFLAPEKTVEFLRLRNNDNKEFSFDYHRLLECAGECSRTEEDETGISDPQTLQKVLELLNFKKILVVDKKREIWDCGDFEVVLDTVAGLGNFIEIEARKDFGGFEKTKEACLMFLNDLNISSIPINEKGYFEMLLKK